MMLINPNKINPQKTYQRIVSLVPSQTELLFDLRLKEQVIGVTKFCVYPKKWQEEKVKVGGTKKTNIPLIRQLSPDLIIANKEENTKWEIETLAMDFDVYVSDVKNLNDATDMIKHVGTLTDTEKIANDIAGNITSEFEKLQNNIFIKRKIKTAYIIWKDPYMVAGSETFIDAMMNYCGLENFYKKQTRYPEISIDELQNNPATTGGAELILLSSEPFPFKEKNIQELRSYMPSLKIMLADGEMFSWYGSRLLKAADYFKNVRNDIDILCK